MLRTCPWPLLPGDARRGFACRRSIGAPLSRGKRPRGFVADLKLSARFSRSRWLESTLSRLSANLAQTIGLGRERTGCFGQSKCRSGRSRTHSVAAALDPEGDIPRSGNDRLSVPLSGRSFWAASHLAAFAELRRRPNLMGDLRGFLDPSKSCTDGRATTAMRRQASRRRCHWTRTCAGENRLGIYSGVGVGLRRR